MLNLERRKGGFDPTRKSLGRRMSLRRAIENRCGFSIHLVQLQTSRCRPPTTPHVWHPSRSWSILVLGSTLRTWRVGWQPFQLITAALTLSRRSWAKQPNKNEAHRSSEREHRQHRNSETPEAARSFGLRLGVGVELKDRSPSRRSPGLAVPSVKPQFRTGYLHIPPPWRVGPPGAKEFRIAQCHLSRRGWCADKPVMPAQRCHRRNETHYAERDQCPAEPAEDSVSQQCGVLHL